MARNYAPLKFSSEMEHPGSMGQFMIKNISKSIERRMSGWDTDRYISALLQFHTGTAERNKDVKIARSMFRKTAGMVIAALGITENDIKEHRVNPVTEWIDIYLVQVLADEWTKNKQVFKPDPDFADALLCTEKLQFTRETFKRLPCKNFYIDLEDCPSFPNMHGIYMDIRDGIDPDRVYLSMILLAVPDEGENLMTFSNYMCGTYNKDGVLELDMKWMQDLAYEYWSPEAAGIGGALSHVNSMGVKTLPYMLALQMICYLSLEEPQVTESPVTKSTYRPRKQGDPIKNKFSEIQMHDVGIRYGSNFRKAVSARSIRPEKTGTEQNTAKKSVRPHFRCAHWHYHRVGKGRKELKLMWHEPTFVSGNIPDSQSDVIIHRVRKES